ncbi:MAG: CpsD/CapB family tyrosine-protein kinase [Catenibacterium mitsuokai]|nr:CpsD/CapB family tyrosine-protein kinase [Catenibacterium mitsuokai]MCI6076966.1 CpsD/CapB family tyrosine-protein kinase [Catenibacterium mitsuokai]
MENNKQNEDLLTVISCIIDDIFHRWVLILAVMFICGSMFDVVKTVNYVPQYGSNMTATLGSGGDTFKNLDKIQSYISTLNYLMNSKNARAYVKKKMDISSTTYTATISTQQANIINFNVTADTKKEAYYAIGYLTEWYAGSTQRYNFPYAINILDESSFSTAPVNYNSHKGNFMKGALVSGAVLVFILALYYFFRDTVKSDKEAKQKLNARLYARIPFEKKKKRNPFKKNRKAILITSLKTSFFYRESINKLRSKVEASSQKHGYTSFMITSAHENEGKSSVGANLALALAKNGHKTILVDMDFRKPSLNKIFELKTNTSLNNAIEGKAHWKSQVVTLDHPGLDLLPCQQDLKNSEKLTGSNRLKAIVEELEEEYDYVIVDVSPAYLLNEPMTINEMMDATLFIVRQDYAEKDMINETISRLTYVKNNVVGIVFNSRVYEPGTMRGTYGYRYGYNRYRTKGGE